MRTAHRLGCFLGMGSRTGPYCLGSVEFVIEFLEST